MISWRRKLTICVAGPAASPSCRPRSPQRSVVVALGALSRHSDTDTRDLRSVRPTATTRKRPDMLTMTRGAFMQAKVRCRCAVERARSRVHPWDSALDGQPASFLRTSPVLIL